MPNTKTLLENHEHIIPLLQLYLGSYNPEIALKRRITVEEIEQGYFDYNDVFSEQDYEGILCPDGAVCGFRTDVNAVDSTKGAKNKAASDNIREGFWLAVAHCLKNNLNPPEIRIVSIINHSQGHWTTSVTTFNLDDDYLAKFREILVPLGIQDLPTFEVINMMNNCVEKVNIREDNKIVGIGNSSVQVNIDHYDSFYPNTKNAGYFKNYKKSIQDFINKNRHLKLNLREKSCNLQAGMTCGDNSVWNGFNLGVLGLSSTDPAYTIHHNADLRAYTEHNVDSDELNPQKSDAKAAQGIRDKIVENIKAARAKVHARQQERAREAQRAQELAIEARRRARARQAQQAQEKALEAQRTKQQEERIRRKPLPKPGVEMQQKKRANQFRDEVIKKPRKPLPERPDMLGKTPNKEQQSSGLTDENNQPNKPLPKKPSRIVHRPQPKKRDKHIEKPPVENLDFVMDILANINIVHMYTTERDKSKSHQRDKFSLGSLFSRDSDKIPDDVRNLQLFIDVVRDSVATNQEKLNMLMGAIMVYQHKYIQEPNAPIMKIIHELDDMLGRQAILTIEEKNDCVRSFQLGIYQIEANAQSKELSAQLKPLKDAATEIKSTFNVSLNKPQNKRK